MVCLFFIALVRNIFTVKFASLITVSFKPFLIVAFTSIFTSVCSFRAASKDLGIELSSYRERVSGIIQNRFNTIVQLRICLKHTLSLRIANRNSSTPSALLQNAWTEHITCGLLNGSHYCFKMLTFRQDLSPKLLIENTVARAEQRVSMFQRFYFTRFLNCSQSLYHLRIRPSLELQQHKLEPQRHISQTHREGKETLQKRI